MARKHLKRLTAPSSWGILRKEEHFITRPHPGPHRLDHCLPLTVVLKRLGIATTSREAAKGLHHHTVLINGRRATSPKTPVGLMDELTIGTNHYRILINTHGHLTITPIPSSETGTVPCKITAKRMAPNARMHIHTLDGRTLLLEQPQPYHLGDTLMITIPKQSITSHLKLESGAYVYLTGGKHLGQHGTVTSIKGNTIVYQSPAGDTCTTLKTYAFVIGKGKASITLP